MAKRQQKSISYHICIPVEKAIELVKAGKNPLYSTPSRAIKILTDYRAAGIEFYTGCESEDVNGRCKGHPNYEE